MTDRLQKLREQRDLILRHLHWIDQEIASEAPATPPTESAQPMPDPGSPGIEKSAPAASPESTLPSIVPDPMEDTHVRSLKNDVRKGCLIYFGIAWLVLLAGVGIIYLIYR